MGPVDYVIAGIIVGALARLLLPGRSPVGCLGTIFIGIAGIYIGGKLWEHFFGADKGVPWIGSILAAMLLLAIFRALSPPRWYER
ncbi:MAG TPA: GlsB/YeaQ/YmgE family stress response membrane protein [Actinomycetota bacterium]|nr:GlsB/YeaQ/YmgE family stress response membrane protein [Actinomycetota bacterium]